MVLDNQIIGISGVFVLTFCLIAVYHLIGKRGPRGSAIPLLQGKSTSTLKTGGRMILRNHLAKTMPGSYGALNSMSKLVLGSIASGSTAKTKATQR